MQLPQKLSVVAAAKGGPAEKLRSVLTELKAPEETWLDQGEEVFVQAALRSGWVGLCGIDIPEDATDADIAVLIRASSGLHKTDAWLRGDVALWVRNNKFGGAIPSSELEKLSRLFGCSGKRILNSATTAAAFPKEMRHPEAPFSLYEVATRIEDPDARYALVEQAIAEGWSIRTMSEQVNALVNNGGHIDANGALHVHESEPVEIDIEECIKELVANAVEAGLLEEDGDIMASTLMLYHSAGLIKFPKKAWANLMNQRTGVKAERSLGLDDEDLAFA